MKKCSGLHTFSRKIFFSPSHLRVRREQGDNQLLKIKMLNIIRVATIDDNDTATLKSKFLDQINANL